MSGRHSHRGRRYLMVSIHDRSWGRTVLALSVAAGLRDAGAQVSFVVHASNQTLVEQAGYDVAIVGNTLGPLMPFALREATADSRPDALVLCDYFSTCNLLHRMGTEDVSFLFARPVIALDLWDSARTGLEVDRAPSAPASLCLIESAQCRRQFLEQCGRMTPAPIAPLTGTTPRVRLLPRARLERPIPHRAAGTTATVLTTTADWQQQPAGDQETSRVARAVPRLLAHYLAALGPRLRWIHVGPEPFDVEDELQDHYVWRGRVSQAALDELFATCDLVISANASATTTVRAILEGTPVILAQNSFAFGPPGEADRADVHASAWLRNWIERTRPLHPFRMWPLGYYGFLAPLVPDNPFFDAVTRAEILHEDVFIETCRRLLYDTSARAASAAAQRAYVAALAEVPGPAEVVHQLLPVARAARQLARGHS